MENSEPERVFEEQIYAYFFFYKQQKVTDIPHVYGNVRLINSTDRWKQRVFRRTSGFQTALGSVTEEEKYLNKESDSL